MQLKEVDLWNLIDECGAFIFALVIYCMLCIQSFQTFILLHVY